MPKPVTYLRRDVLVEYTRMRDNGLDSKATLHALRPYIEPLPESHKVKLAQYLRQWESGELKLDRNVPSDADEITRQDYPTIPEEPSTPTPSSPIKSIARQTPRPGEDLLPKGLKPGATWVACPNCHTKNKANEVFCYACGHIIDSGQGVHSTRNFADADMETLTPEYFSGDSLLILQLRDSGAYYKLRPQNSNHELVIGRSNADTAMTPDVDLAEENAEAFGVSRLHIAIQYVMDNSMLTIYDLGSANGSYINGQKLHPSENRILRNGDELRLGRMVIRVFYEHPGTEVK
jgi:hypothetical protein